MAVKKVKTEEALAEQIGQLGGAENIEETVGQVSSQAASPGVGQKLSHFGGNDTFKEDVRKMNEEKQLTQLGGSLKQQAEIREGWIDVDRRLLGERDKFYPEDWQFRIRPANVEAIRNWSTIDENVPNSVDTVFDEILKSCLAIRTTRGPLPWSQIYSWDRFFFVLLAREYTFEKGESKVEFTRACPNCGSDVTFTLSSTSLMYDMPDAEVMDMFDQDNRCWRIYPADYDVEWKDEVVTLFLPTREKDNSIKEYIFNKVQEDRNAPIDRVFMRFLPWMLEKISKDSNLAAQQIRKAEMEFKSWSADMFSFMDDVLKNITITPQSNLLGVCPACGEEATAPIQFPNGVSSLFAMAGRHKKFGKK